jgi:hypothetical protein
MGFELSFGRISAHERGGRVIQRTRNPEQERIVTKEANKEPKRRHQLSSVTCLGRGSGSNPGIKISKPGGTVFGFGKGKITTSIQKTSYAPGDVITGNVALILKKPVKAREVSISLIGTGKLAPYEAGEGTMHSLTWERIYEFKQSLDGEKEYSEGQEYRFDMKIPADILSRQFRPKRSRAFTLSRRGFEEVPFGEIKWYLLAKLDIPGGLDVSKKVDITIG